MPDTTPTTTSPVTAIIGAGLAGCEAAWQLAEAGYPVKLFEMKPHHFTEAHELADLAELVCSNSFRSNLDHSAPGVLKRELRDLQSLLIRVADDVAVPAGKALAVDRKQFAANVTEAIEKHPNIELIRREIRAFNDTDLAAVDRIILAAGPLATDTIVKNLQTLIGEDYLYFYDAIAPIVETESVDMENAFWASRYADDEDEADYLNCPMSQEEFDRFYNELIRAERVNLANGEQEIHFEGCMPIEALADRGKRTLAFGSLKPVGLRDPRTDTRPAAVLQLRHENREGTMVNLVGCQTKLKYGEQDRVFRLIPALKDAVFLRYGSMHRNTFVNAPRVLNEDLSLKANPHVHLAGQITGVEGYIESIACGLWASRIVIAAYQQNILTPPPRETELGGLLAHLRTETDNFQPMKANFGLMPPLAERVPKRQRKEAYAERARTVWQQWRQDMQL